MNSDGAGDSDFGTKVGHVNLRVSDLDRSIKFYTEVLGLALRGLTEAFDLFWLLLIHVRDLRRSRRSADKQFVKFGVKGLGASVLGALDEQRHQPGGDRGNPRQR
ncbi:catechol 2,3-dioxygenase-like lactoylglutathione lyase family enzyme [Mycoplana sp. BE70]|nr:catechol 2,3-dioxygenase-like lactoylglutathione lyase family enzyme [Mycoplana sp. BE70]